MTAAAKARPTGVVLLDDAIGPALAPGGTILALGEPASGMELFAKEFAARAPSTLYYAPDESAEEVEAVVRRFNPDAKPRVVDIASDYYERVLRQRVTPEGIRVRGLRAAKAEPVRHARDPEVPDFLEEILREIATQKPPRVVVDTLDFFFELYPAADVVRSVRALRLTTRRVGALLYLGKIRNTAEAATERLLEHIADVVLHFEVDRTRAGNEWTLSVTKVRNEPHMAATIAYRPTSEGLIRDPRKRV